MGTKATKNLIEIDNRLTKGVVTQNGSYISYKTEWYGEWNSFHQELFHELKVFLEKNKIRFKGDDFKARLSDNSNRRKGCVTISVEMISSNFPIVLNVKYANVVLPYEADAIN